MRPSPSSPPRALWPLLAFAGALGLYLATMARVHRGDTVGLLVETRMGLAHDPAHLLVRPLLGLVLGAGDALVPALSPWSLMAGVAAVAGSLVAAGAMAWLLRRRVAPGLALVAVAALSLSFSGWSLSTTFEAHGLPLAGLLGMALALDQRPLSAGRAALGGLLFGLAAGLHFIAAPVGLAWVALVVLEDRPWRVRLGRMALVLLTAGLVLQVGHTLTFFGPDHGGPSTSWLYPVALVEQARQLASTEAVRGVPLADLPVAVLTGFARGAIAEVRILWPWAGALVALLALVAVRVRPLVRRFGPAVWVPLVWLLATLPLASWVGPHNYEYYRGTWVAVVLLVTLLGWDLVAERGRWVRAGPLVLGVAVVASLVLVNRGAVSADRTSPTGEPVGVVEGPPWLLDGRSTSYAKPP